MAPTVYTVLTHFQFEAGHAIATSDKLASSVDRISQSAERAQTTLKNMGLAFVANFGLGTTSVLGVLGQALKASDNLQKSQLVLANIISSNMHNLTGDIGTFNDRMAVSAKILKDISTDAKKFGLPEQELGDMTKMMSAMLVPKGLAGQNFGTARTMSRNLLKSAPTLGVDPQLVQGQLLRLIEDTGQADMQNTLFRRLTTETKAFRDVLGGATNAAKKFNSLPLKQRFELVNMGLSQFASDMDVLANNSQSIGSMMRRLSDIFMGFNGILIPLGQTLMGPLKLGFEQLIQLLDNQGRRSVSEFSNILKIMIGDIEATAATLGQAKRVGADFRLAGLTLTLGVLGQFLVQIGLLAPGLRILLIPIGFIAKAIRFVAPAFLFLGKVLGMIALAAAKFMLAMLPIFVLFQTISRAIAIARINDLKAVPEFIAKAGEQLNRVSTLFGIVFGPFLKLMDTIAKGIAPVFQFSHWLTIISSVFEFLTDGLVVLFAVIRGFVFAISAAVQNLVSGNFRKALSPSEFTKRFGEGRDDFFDEFLRKTQKEDGSVAVASMVTNISKVEINNQFKEQLEPDRIAFALTDQLKRVAANPQSGAGRSRDKGTFSR